MKKKITALAGLTLINFSGITSAFAENIVIKFPKGSYCGSYFGRIGLRDTFSLNLAKNQTLVITNPYGQEYSVIAPNGKILPVANYVRQEVREYYTGNQAGIFKIRIDHLYDSPTIDLQICAY